MTTWTHASLACSIVAAALVIRTALGELRRPGTAREQRLFLTNTAAVMTGAASAAVLGAALVFVETDPGHAVWALLGGILTAFIVDRLMDQAGKGRE
ncbi:hypothetical protein FBY35_0248 [Streptomyces sp. SLBN-118]|uniref:hypothetical protein n=1 Tax=Streptomyces sp. SLBN-118 TaxID=2768454 RepID=UPI00114E0D64|nr:hypothetical protein [Streptomyces sp. SLBN-118]TQK49957.1 hypothetical protein FBY35_0248 [Streptomyces sp. SLBN-118]